MDKKLVRLPEAELEIMLIVWNAEPSITASYILENLKERSWSLQTLFTVLKRLEDKGFLKSTKQGRSKLYYPIVKESEYKETESVSFLERLYNNSFKNMVASLVNANALNAQDIEDLKAYLDELKEGEE